MTFPLFRVCGLFILGFVALSPSLGAAPVDGLETDYLQHIRPLLARTCQKCHSAKHPEADIELEAFATLLSIRKAIPVWQRMLEMVDSGQMPPKDAKPLTADERERLSTWIRAFLKNEAKSHAGDPGRVLLRRLSNAEYTYTLRDITGVESLQPAREFPVDGAAGEGFTNTGDALVMSPALLTKYLAAAKGIAAHAVLLPDGIRFTNHTTRRDWATEVLEQIRTVYGTYSDSGIGTKVSLQGLVWDAKEGGRLPVGKYLAATIQHRESLQSGRKTLEAVAKEQKLSAKYLGLVWTFLTATEPAPLLDDLRARWRTAKSNDLPALTAQLTRWQNALWKFNSIGHIGKLDGPKSWLEAADPLVVKHEVRFKLPASKADEVTLYLVATSVGDGTEPVDVIWQQAKFVAPGRPDLLLKDVPGLSVKLDNGDLKMKVPSVVEIRVPAKAVAGADFVATGVMQANTPERSLVQLSVMIAKPGAVPTLQPGSPILVANDAAHKQIAAALQSFRDVFPIAVCYTKIVPVDEVVTLTLYYREDHLLSRMLLDDTQARKLDRLWEELRYISQDALTQVDAFTQLMEFATQDSNPKLFEPLRKPIADRAIAFNAQLIDTQPQHLKAVLTFAAQAYRHPLTAPEASELTALYHKLRRQDVLHDDAIRLLLARVLVSPVFLYKLEKANSGAVASSLNDWELANRLSYFLWSSAPDVELQSLAVAGKLRDPDVLVAQMQRMRRDPKVRRLATEFACQWLHIRGFEEMNEKSERHFPTFTGLRGAMAEESVLFFTDLFQHDRTVLNLLNADYTYLNEPLAKHYGIPGISGNQWRRVEGVQKYGRGGILGLSTTLATQSGASRTSPILRGNWVSEVLLGEKLPRPPKGVPQLPDDEAMTVGLTVRQLVEKHTTDAKCAVCHKRIDAYGFALEGFDAIGRQREKDLGNRPIDTHAKTADGAEFDGIDGLRNYLLIKRKAAIVRQFCKKLLGYALGRSAQLSDEPLLDDLQTALAKNGYRVDVVLEAIVRSKQFREIRGRDHE